MNARKALVAFMTFVGGLYFILEFIVPPTMPFATHTGIALSKKTPSFTVKTTLNELATVQIDSSVTCYLKQRDPDGILQPKTRKSREIFPGLQVTLRTRTIKLGGFGANGERLDDGGKPIVFKSGEVPYTTDGADTSQMAWTYQRLTGRINSDRIANIYMMGPDESVNVEIRDAVVQSVNRGQVTMVVKGKEQEIDLTNASMTLRHLRRSQPEEVELYQVNLGDTISIGPNTIFRDQRDTATQFNSVIGTMALGMGLLSLGMVNFRRIKKRDKEWYTALIFFGAVVLGVIGGIGKYYPMGTGYRSYSDALMIDISGAMGTAIFSLLSFYLASAAYRAFRIRTFEAGLLMVTALIVMFGQTPFGMYISGWIPQDFQALWLPNISAWILRVPSSAFIRALTFGAMMGAIGMALRYWLNMERPAMGDD